MKTIKLLTFLLFASLVASAQGTYINFGATVLDNSGNAVPNHPVTVIDSTNNPIFPGIIQTYLTDANGQFVDSTFTGVAGTIYMLTADSCQNYLFDTMYSGNTTTLNWFRTFNLLCSGSGGGSGNCNFTVSATGPTATGMFQFNSTYQANPASTFSWSFGDGTTSTMQNPTHAYTAPGTYVYCLTVDNCPAVCDTLVVTSSNNCNGYFTSLLSGSTLQISPVSVGGSGTLLFNWGDGWIDTVAASAIPIIPYNHTYSAPGNYTVCVTHSDATPGCTDTYCDSIFVSANALQCNASFIVDTVNSQPGNVVIWNTSSVSNASSSAIVSFNWDFGDGSSSTLAFPTHQYQNAGGYVVCLTISATDMTATGPVTCTSTHCDSLYVDQNGNIIYKGAIMGWTLVVLDAKTIGIDEDIFEGLNFYPNPVNDVLNIEIPENLIENIEINLYNINGQKVNSLVSRSNQRMLNLDTEFLTSGMYILEVISDGQAKQFKVTKQN